MADLQHAQLILGQLPFPPAAGRWDWLQRDAGCLTGTEHGPIYVRDGEEAAPGDDCVAD